MDGSNNPAGPNSEPHYQAFTRSFCALCFNEHRGPLKECVEHRVFKPAALGRSLRRGRSPKPRRNCADRALGKSSLLSYADRAISHSHTQTRCFITAEAWVGLKYSPITQERGKSLQRNKLRSRGRGHVSCPRSLSSPKPESHSGGGTYT